MNVPRAVRSATPSLATLAQVFTLGCFVVCFAQKDSEHDYQTLALNSVLVVIKETAKVPDLTQRITLYLRAAEMLRSTHPDDARRVLERALADIQPEHSAHDWTRRYRATRLLTQVLAAWSKLDPDETLALTKRLQPEDDSLVVQAPPTDSWIEEFARRSASADQQAKLAQSIIKTNPEEAIKLLVLSTRAGSFSSAIPELVSYLQQRRERALLNQAEQAIATAVAHRVTFDPYSISSAALLFTVDEQMPAVARDALLGFLLRSLDALLIVSQETKLNSSYLARVHLAFNAIVRPAIARHLPAELGEFDLKLEQLKRSLPETTIPANDPNDAVRTSSYRERVNEILKRSSTRARDAGLEELLWELLKSGNYTSRDNLDLAEEAIGKLSNAEARSIFSNFLNIVRINSLLKTKQYAATAELLKQLTPEEMRVWASLAVARHVRATHPVFAFELVRESLQGLEKIESGSNKVELALTAAAMIVEQDVDLAFEVLERAVKYANSTPRGTGPQSPAFSFGVGVSIGSARMKLGSQPENLASVAVDAKLGQLAIKDWFRAQDLADGIREPALRLRLKLVFADAVLNRKKNALSSLSFSGEPLRAYVRSASVSAARVD